MRDGSVALSVMIDERKIEVSDRILVNSCLVFSVEMKGIEPVMSETESGSA